MIFDKTTMFSEAQKLANGQIFSTNVVDLGPVANGLKRDIGKGTPIPILIQVVENFDKAGNLAVRCEVSKTENFSGTGNVRVAWQSNPMLFMAAAPGDPEAKAGHVFVPEAVTRGTNERYMRLVYTVSGTANNTVYGSITAGITMGNQSNG